MKKNLPVSNSEKTFADDANILSTTNLKGAITYVNPDFVDISGFDEDELIGKSHNMVRHPDMPPAAFKDLWQTVKSGESWMGVVKNRCKNGDYYWVNAYVSPIVKDGEICEYQSVRSKASAEEIRRAEKLYARLNAGKLPRWLTRQPLKFRYKLIITFLLLQLATLGIPVINGGLSPLMACSACFPVSPSHRFFSTGKFVPCAKFLNGPETFSTTRLLVMSSPAAMMRRGRSCWP